MVVFRNIDEQITILHKRGIRFKNKKDYRKAKLYLLVNNYYTLINGYGIYFQTNTNQYNGIYFDEITKVYEFDIEIKNALLQGILTSEKHLKALLGYYISQKCDEFYDLEIYLNPNFYSIDISYQIENMKRIIDKHSKDPRNNPIKNHKRKHGEVPFWVLVNYLSFFDLLKIFEGVPSIQNNVAKRLYRFSSHKFSFHSQFTPIICLSFLTNIYETRNICAHGNRLLDFKCKKNTKFYAPLHNKYTLPPSAGRQDVYNTFLILQCFMSDFEYAKMHNTIRKRMNYLENHINYSTYKKVLKSLGFPEEWNRRTSNLKQY